jgi:probable HAF family extracellular repeat protein
LGPTTGANYSQAEAINDANIVVGTSGEADVDGNLLWYYAVRWIDDGKTVEELGTLEGGRVSEAFDINGKGQIVGNSETADRTVHAFLWEDQRMTDLGTLDGDIASNARAINEVGQVVGVSINADNEAHGFLWQDDEITRLETLGGAISQPYDINDAGQIVGAAYDDEGRRFAVMWDEGKIINLGVRGVATSINAVGVVTGVFVGEDQAFHPFLWVDDTVVELREVKDTSGFPMGINGGGVIVGLACPSEGCEGDTFSQWRAAFWQNGKVARLSSLLSERSDDLWILQGAYDINNKGNIVGTGYYTVEENQVPRGYLLWARATASDIGTAAQTTDATATPTEPAGDGPPREFEFQGDWYLRDRIVPITPGDLAEAGVDPVGGEAIIYARSTEPPYDALYLPVSNDVGDGMYRYLSQHIDRPDQACPAESPAKYASLAGSEVDKYVFAGNELDLTTSMLVASQTAGIWKEDVPADVPVPEFFVESDYGLQRLVLLTDGVPAQLTSPLSFAGQKFQLTQQMTKAEAQTQGNRKRIGCAGSFRAEAVLGEDTQPFRRIFVTVADQVLVFNASIQDSEQETEETGETQESEDSAALNAAPHRALAVRIAGDAIALESARNRRGSTVQIGRRDVRYTPVTFRAARWTAPPAALSDRATVSSRAP